MKFGLIGNPIAHSLSPALFKAGFAGRYPYDLIEGEDFRESYMKFIKDYDGINVTAPFKEEAFAEADIISEECRLIKAANILTKTSDGIMAFNSDYLGVRKWLEETIEAGSGKAASVLIAGCGGAGKAAAIAAASLGLKVILMNRDISKAEAVAEVISHMHDAPVTEVRPLGKFTDTFRDCEIIIYNIPVAIREIRELSEEDFKGRCGTSVPYVEKHLLEANYRNPSFTKDILDMAARSNPSFTYTEGKVWLLYQAVTGYEIFTGETPDLASMSAVL